MASSECRSGPPFGRCSHQKVQVWVYTESLVLLLKTTDKRGGFWQPITGSVEKGESSTTAALREFKEETGLSHFENIVPIQYQFTFTNRNGQKVEEHCFAIKLNSAEPIQLDPKEHVEYQWIQPQKALKLLKFPSNQIALERLFTQK